MFLKQIFYVDTLRHEIYWKLQELFLKLQFKKLLRNSLHSIEIEMKDRIGKQNFFESYKLHELFFSSVKLQITL